MNRPAGGARVLDVDTLMAAGELRAGDVFSLPGVVVRGPFRVLRAAALPGMVAICMCDPDEETAYPLTPDQLSRAASCRLGPQDPVVLHDRNRY